MRVTEVTVELYSRLDQPNEPQWDAPRLSAGVLYFKPYCEAPCLRLELA